MTSFMLIHDTDNFSRRCSVNEPQVFSAEREFDPCLSGFIVTTRLFTLDRAPDAPLPHVELGPPSLQTVQHNRLGVS